MNPSASVNEPQSFIQVCVGGGGGGGGKEEGGGQLGDKLELSLNAVC